MNAHRLRIYKRLESDQELHARLAEDVRFPRFRWQLAQGISLDAVAEAMGMVRRIVEVESA